jgi:hypothetical protein
MALACHKEHKNNCSICGGFRATSINGSKDERITPGPASGFLPTQQKGFSFSGRQAALTGG